MRDMLVKHSGNCYDKNMDITRMAAREFHEKLSDAIHKASTAERLTVVSLYGHDAAVLVPANSKLWRGVAKAIREAEQDS